MHAATLEHDVRLGVIGLGTMGFHFARNLSAAGYAVTGFDLNPERLSALEPHGVVAATDATQLVRTCDVVICSLPSSEAFVRVGETQLVPFLREGQVVIETGTTIVSEIRRLSELMALRGCALLDAPVSGGGGGAERRDLFMWVGGCEATYLRCRRLLETISGSAKLAYCGASGAGQIIKGINQLRMGLMAAAELEAFAFAERCGLDRTLVRRVLAAGRHPGAAMAERLFAGEGTAVGVKFRELPYYLREADDAGFDLPLTRALYAFCDSGERVTIDDHRPAPSFWHELMRERH